MALAKSLYTPQEVADLLSVSRSAVYAWINEGKLKSLKVGGDARIIRVTASAILEIITPNEA